MKIENKNIEKLCSFYVSDWHLTTMILPYINSKIEKNINIIPILENNLEENIKILVEKLNLKNKEQILSINWKNINSIKYEDIKNKLNKEIKKDDEKNLKIESGEIQNIILVNGSKDYIEKNNSNIEKWIEKSPISNIKIINFFEVTDFNSNIVEILNNHDRVFNTSGEKEISEVFNGYKMVKG